MKQRRAITGRALKIVERVLKNKAVGIIYNIPKGDEAILKNKLLDERKAVILKGSDAYTAPMFLFRLSSTLKAKHLSFHMIPALIDGKLVAVTGADVIKTSYNRVLDDSFKYKVPILLLMNTDQSMREFRKLAAYRRVLTIEQNYQEL